MRDVRAPQVQRELRLRIALCGGALGGAAGGALGVAALAEARRRRATAPRIIDEAEEKKVEPATSLGPPVVGVTEPADTPAIFSFITNVFLLLKSL